MHPTIVQPQWFKCVLNVLCIFRFTQGEVKTRLMRRTHYLVPDEILREGQRLLSQAIGILEQDKGNKLRSWLVKAGKVFEVSTSPSSNLDKQRRNPTFKTRFLAQLLWYILVGTMNTFTCLWHPPEKPFRLLSPDLWVRNIMYSGLKPTL